MRRTSRRGTLTVRSNAVGPAASKSASVRAPISAGKTVAARTRRFSIAPEYCTPDSSPAFAFSSHGRNIGWNRSGSEKITRLSEPVRGTAITYEDLALKFLYWSNSRVIGSDFIRTRNCWKVQLQAPAGDPQYGSILLWVDKDSGALMRMEGYDSAGKLVKRFEVVSAQKIEDRWYLKQMRVEKIDPLSNRATARTYLEIKK